MGEREGTLKRQNMATTSTAVATVPPQLQEESEPRVAVITLRQTRAPQRERKKVVWTEDTVDNEHMNKKKSKCCCIYEKPRKFGESDSEDSDDECEHCSGHVEHKHAKHQHQHQHQHHAAPTSTAAVQLESTSTEPSIAVTLLADEPKPAPAPPDKAPEDPKTH